MDVCNWYYSTKQTIFLNKHIKKLSQKQDIEVVWGKEIKLKWHYLAGVESEGHKFWNP